MISICGGTLMEISNQVQGFQHLIRDYQVQEGILSEMGKKYFRSLKTIQNSIEAYKATFTDVKLIYNSEERVRRYTSCQNDYNTISEEHAHILQKIVKMNTLKQSLTKSYEGLIEEEKKMMKSITSRKIAETKNFTHSYCIMHKNLLTVLVDKKILLESISLQSIFSSFNSLLKPQYLTCETNPDVYKSCPPILFYHSHIREEYLHTYSRLLVDFVKEVTDRVQNRKLVNRKVLDFQQFLVKIMDKILFSGLKESMAFFEKNKKRTIQLFGKRVVSFLKSINSILELAVGINEKLLKSISNRLMNTQMLIQEDTKLLDFLLKELNTNLEKFVGKKELKKLKNNENGFTEEEAVVDTVKSRKEIGQRAQFLIHLLGGFNQKMVINCNKIRNDLNQTVNDIFLSNNELYSLALQYQGIYFGQEEFHINLKKYENQFAEIMNKSAQFYNQIIFSSLLKDRSKIVFDGEIQKYQEFKKLKKAVVQEPKSQQSKKNSQFNQEGGTSEQINQKHQEQTHHQDEKNIQRSNEKPNFIPHQSFTNPRDIKQAKHIETLLSKITLIEGQQFIKTFTCGLSDKIILQGRIFITTQRICFHSNFNPSNVFFGGTFIQVPKKDIKKIQKRANAIFFQNSISITTINGQIFLTSFFSRDEAYNLLCKIFQINEDHVFEQSLMQEQPALHIQVLPSSDDISQEELIQREKKITPLMNPEFAFKDLFTTQIHFNEITAFLILKQFYSWSEITVNRKQYKGFTYYLRVLCDHKDIEVSEWKPNLKEYLNATNIKSNTPMQFQLQSDETCPLPNSPIPFMPKSAKNHEEQKLWIVSKDKWVIESKIKTNAPYGDTFDLYLRTSGQTTGENKCQIKYQIFINFLKKTMVSSIIESKTIQQSTNSVRQMTDQIKKYLKNLNKQKPIINNVSMEMQKDQAANLHEAQIEELKLINEKLEKGLKQQKQKTENYRKFIFGLALLNLFLIFILLIS